MNLNKIKRLKNLGDCEIPTYAILIDNLYILIHKLKYPKIYRSIDRLYEDKAMEYAALKREIKQCNDAEAKNKMFEKMREISYSIGI